MLKRHPFTYSKMRSMSSTPEADAPQSEVDKLIDLLKYTKANIIQVDPEKHDEIVGAISHLPHIIAVALVNQIRDYNNIDELYCILAAGGFRDITRIASSDPVVWRDILIDNRSVLLKLLKDWNEGTSSFIRMLEERGWGGDRVGF